jgi:hypothetical protein
MPTTARAWYRLPLIVSCPKTGTRLIVSEKSFPGGSEFDGAAANGTVRRSKVCIMEIGAVLLQRAQNLKRTDSL